MTTQEQNSLSYNKTHTENVKCKQMHMKLNLNLNQHSTLRTAHMSVRNAYIIVHNCRTQHSTEQFW